VTTESPNPKVRPFIAEMPAPHPDESLHGYIDRAAQRTVVRNLGTMLRLAGSTKKTSFPRPFNTDPEEARGLAALFKLTPHEMLSRLYPWGEFDHVNESTIEFFGTKIRAQYLESTVRRVSPRALRISPHHRAIWDLRPFAFDPATREQLLVRCPACDTRLGWHRLAGPASCGHCVDERGRPTDLRVFPQPIVELDDEEATDFAIALVHPDRAKRDLATKLVPDELRSVPASDLFEAIVSIASILRPSNVHQNNAVGRPKTLKEFEDLTPDLLVMGVRAIIGGEEGFARVADRMRTTMERRPAAHGIFKEIGPLAATAVDKKIAPAMQVFFRKAIERDFARTADLGFVRKRTSVIEYTSETWRNINDLHREFGVPATAISRLAESGLVETRRVADVRSPIMINRADFIPLANLYKDAVDERSASAQLQVSYGALAELARRKVIERVEGPTTALLGDAPYYRLSTISALLMAINRRADRPVPPQKGPFLNRAASAFAPHVPWPTIIELILSGGILIHRRRESAKNWPAAVGIDDPENFRQVIADAAHADVGSNEDWLRTHEAALLLGCRRDMVSRLQKQGLLHSRRSRSRFYSRAELEAFRRKYIFGREMLARSVFKIQHQLYRWLRSEGIVPKMKLMMRAADPIFDRAEFEQALKSLPAPPPKVTRKPGGRRLFTSEEKQQIVDAVRRGLPVNWLSKRMRAKPRSIDKWVEEFEETGKISSAWKLEEQEDALKAIIAGNPKQSFGSIRRELGVKVSSAGLIDHLKRMGYRRNRRGELRLDRATLDHDAAAFESTSTRLSEELSSS
jgi:transposase-like protein